MDYDVLLNRQCVRRLVTGRNNICGQLRGERTLRYTKMDTIILLEIPKANIASFRMTVNYWKMRSGSGEELLKSIFYRRHQLFQKCFWNHAE